MGRFRIGGHTLLYSKCSAATIRVEIKRACETCGNLNGLTNWRSHVLVETVIRSGREYVARPVLVGISVDFTWEIEAPVVQEAATIARWKRDYHTVLPRGRGQNDELNDQDQGK